MHNLIVMAHWSEHVERYQQNVNHHGGEGCDLDEQSYFDSFVGVGVVFKESVIEYDDTLYN